MPRNLYHFTGPLDPVEHSLTCITRGKEIDRVIEGLLHGDYWVILGPRQIGKTTLLRQIKHELAVYPSIYIDLESSPDEDEAFYESIINSIREIFSEKPGEDFEKDTGSDLGHKMNFFHFLKTFRTAKDKKIILFFDEIEKAPAVHAFLNMWRKIFHERIDHQELKKYALVIAGSADLIPLTIGPTSPFNIARKLYLSHLAPAEAEQLIEKPLRQLGIGIETGGKEQLLAQTSGHPQLLQHLCHILVEQAMELQRPITDEDVREAIEEFLFIENDNLKTLDQQIKQNETLRHLVKRILAGEKVRYAPYQQFSLSGVGPIVGADKYCTFRCNVYKEFLEQLLETTLYQPPPAGFEAAETGQTAAEPQQNHDILYKTIIYSELSPPVLTSGRDDDLRGKDDADKKKEEEKLFEEEAVFLKRLFRCKSIPVEIVREGIDKKRLELQGKEKLIFCYLAYKNYKAYKKDGYADWKDIPDSYKYRLSSNTQNNKEFQPEWPHLIKYFEEIGEKKPVDQDIRQWKFALQKTLESIGMKDIIDSKKSGRGGGYLLKGSVAFVPLYTPQ